uniref:Uncharacterized protein n=1 Tax=Timema monikensis TaxID=170555 RepID=A0A7R9HNK0_9NEOP|nr:unnamed protein product [Timema monikensis]
MKTIRSVPVDKDLSRKKVPLNHASFYAKFKTLVSPCEFGNQEDELLGLMALLKGCAEQLRGLAVQAQSLVIEELSELD